MQSLARIHTNASTRYSTQAVQQTSPFQIIIMMIAPLLLLPFLLPNL